VSWGDLARLGVRVRPFVGVLPPSGDGSPWAFKASLSSTVDLLYRELRALEASGIIIELDIADSDIRLDGLPRANARLQRSEAIAVSFDSPHGPLRYVTNEYGRWEANLRSIALTLQALRAVDRYGTSKRGEQYRGFRAIPASTDPADQIATAEQARAVIEELGGGSIREALRATHPDHGGDADDFRRVTKARQLLEGAAA
jgi:hypothetical protein